MATLRDSLVACRIAGVGEVLKKWPVGVTLKRPGLSGSIRTPEVRCIWTKRFSGRASCHINSRSSRASLGKEMNVCAGTVILGSFLAKSKDDIVRSAEGRRRGYRLCW